MTDVISNSIKNMKWTDIKFNKQAFLINFGIAVFQGIVFYLGLDVLTKIYPTQNLYFQWLIGQISSIRLV
jgi:hypothetical protein